MAIYKNREVSVNGLTTQATTPQTVSIKYKDGTNEHVNISHVAYTKAEKEGLKKTYPNIFDSLPEATDEDVSAVKVGATPPSDPTLKEQAETKARHKKQQDMVNKANKDAQDNAEKDLDKEINKPSTTPSAQSVTFPQTDHQSYNIPNQAK